MRSMKGSLVGLVVVGILAFAPTAVFAHGGGGGGHGGGSGGSSGGHGSTGGHSGSSSSSGHSSSVSKGGHPTGDSSTAPGTAGGRSVFSRSRIFSSGGPSEPEGWIGNDEWQSRNRRGLFGFIWY